MEKQSALQHWRERIGLSQRKLADVIGISQPTLRSIELGEWVPGPMLVRTIRYVTSRLAPKYGVLEADDFQKAWEEAHPPKFDPALRARVEAKRKELSNGKKTYGAEKRARQAVGAQGNGRSAKARVGAAG